MLGILKSAADNGNNAFLNESVTGMDFTRFKAVREIQVKDDRLTLENEEDFKCCCFECREDFDFDADYFFDICISDVDVDVLFTTPVDEINEPNPYDEDSDDGDDTNNDTILNLNKQWEANKPRVSCSDYTKGIWHSPIPDDAYELLVADLDHYKKHYFTPRGTDEEKKLLETLSYLLLCNGVQESCGWVPPNQRLQSLGAMTQSKIQNRQNLEPVEVNPEFLAAANHAMREYPSYLLSNSNPETLASFRGARTEWALLDCREWNGLPRIAN